MQTSYFAKYKGDNAVSIAVGTPGWVKAEKATELMPTREMVKEGYTYNEYICLLKSRDLTAEKIYEKYKDKILMCWEKDVTVCHRGMLARWLSQELNIKIPEYSNENIFINE